MDSVRSPRAGGEPLPASGLPTLTAWTSLGGILQSGPAVAVVDGAITFLVEGGGNQAWSRTTTQPWGPFQGWMCQGHPALASAGSIAYAACNGTDGQLWYSVRSGGSWDPTLPAGGRLIDGPGIAAFPDQAIVAVEGTDGKIYENAVARGRVPSGWAQLPLTATRGASASAL